jgi:hypothetical protein
MQVRLALAAALLAATLLAAALAALLARMLGLLAGLLLAAALLLTGLLLTTLLMLWILVLRHSVLHDEALARGLGSGEVCPAGGRNEEIRSRSSGAILQPVDHARVIDHDYVCVPRTAWRAAPSRDPGSSTRLAAKPRNTVASRRYALDPGSSRRSLCSTPLRPGYERPAIEDLR